MFGYIRPYKPELLIKHFTLYKAFYCGLCETLQKDYGLVSRFILSFDCTFAAMVLTYISGNESEYCFRGRCKLKPVFGRCAMAKGSQALEFAGALNVLLTYYKLDDDVRDEHSIASFLGRSIMKKAACNARKKYPDLDIVILNGLAKLQEAESSNCRSIDTPANAFAEMLAGCLVCFPSISQRNAQIMYQFMFNIGRFIYIADAWNDRIKDKNKGSYNPFVANDEYDSDRVALLLDVAATIAKNAYSLFDDGNSNINAVLENIIGDGCIHTASAVIAGSFRTTGNNESGGFENGSI